MPSARVATGTVATDRRCEKREASDVISRRGMWWDMMEFDGMRQTSTVLSKNA